MKLEQESQHLFPKQPQSESRSLTSLKSVSISRNKHAKFGHDFAYSLW